MASTYRTANAADYVSREGELDGLCVYQISTKFIGGRLSRLVRRESVHAPGRQEALSRLRTRQDLQQHRDGRACARPGGAVDLELAGRESERHVDGHDIVGVDVRGSRLQSGESSKTAKAEKWPLTAAALTRGCNRAEHEIRGCIVMYRA
jgi:hypothetical protein